MSLSLLPPGQRPDAVRDVPAPPPKPGRDFAHHVTPRNEAASQTKQDAHASTQDAVLATEKLLASKVVITPLTEPEGGAVIYAQSLRVVGYLSMLGRGSAPTDGVAGLPAEVKGAQAAASQAFVPGAAPSVEEMVNMSANPAFAGTMAGGRLAPSSDVQDPSTPIEMAATTVPSEQRFARRFVRLSSGSLLLRDFSLTPDHAKAVLDAFRAIAAGDGQPLTRALVNGKPYLLDKKDDHVG
jgi:hypothetical protein